MKIMKIIPVILSGGSGTRLWPLSRKQYPKQYLSLTGVNTMLQETILRLNGLKNLSKPIIVCNEDHRFLVAEQCQQIGLNKPTILLEPVGKNTAPAIAVSALQAENMSENSILLVLPADHIIQDVDEFYKAIDIATKQAQQGKLVVFGVTPTDANTGYGYIKFSRNKNNYVYQVEQFVEKPNLKTAQLYLEQSCYLWNSGMCMFYADKVLKELAIYSPNNVKSTKSALNNATKDLDFIRLDRENFKSSPSGSIDCVLMEKSNNVVVVPLDAQWSDVGSWSALYNTGEKDDNGNVIKGDVMIKDTINTYINAHHHKVVALGIRDLIVVDTPDATFISTQNKSHEVDSIVEVMQLDGYKECDSHRKVYRPWGWYDSIELGLNYQVKRLHIKIGAKLSLQMHQKRAEHWIVIKGVATVVNGKGKLTLNVGESTYIPLGVVHSLENNGRELLEVIEVQSGKYLGEDDITRFEDAYGRK